MGKLGQEAAAQRVGRPRQGHTACLWQCLSGGKGSYHGPLLRPALLGGGDSAE